MAERRKSPKKSGGKPEKTIITCGKPEKGTLAESGKSHFHVTESWKT